MITLNCLIQHFGLRLLKKKKFRCEDRSNELQLSPTVRVIKVRSLEQFDKIKAFPIFSESAEPRVSLKLAVYK